MEPNTQRGLIAELKAITTELLDVEDSVTYWLKIQERLDRAAFLCGREADELEARFTEQDGKDNENRPTGRGRHSGTSGSGSGY